MYIDFFERRRRECVRKKRSKERTPKEEERYEEEEEEAFINRAIWYIFSLSLVDAKEPLARSPRRSFYYFLRVLFPKVERATTRRRRRRRRKNERRTVVRSRVPNAGGHVPRFGPDRRPVGVRRERRGHERNDDEVISDESKQTRRELDEFGNRSRRRVRGRAEERKHGWGWRGC